MLLGILIKYYIDENFTESKKYQIGEDENDFIAKFQEDYETDTYLETDLNKLD